MATTARAVMEFLRTEAIGGVVLLVGALVALIWANSPWSGGYRSLWETRLSIGPGGFSLALDLRHWVNDGLMAIFFFVVGLEIKRELVEGELRDRRRAAVPAVAALGGMVVPASIYLAITAGTGGARGWGIPMATDIAFAVGLIALLGPRVPGPLKLFLLTLAIVDDIAAVVVVAIFYSGEVRPEYLLLAVLLLGSVLAVYRTGLMRTPMLVVLALGIWLATHQSGVHATIAGVALAFVVPVRSAPARRGSRPNRPASSGARAPAGEHLETVLHPVSTFAVVPLFALANAGVAIKANALDAPGAGAVALGVSVGLVVGKALGITGATWLAVRTGLGPLPNGSTWPMVFGVSVVAGIGFTISLFIADLAFDSAPLQNAAKVGILGGFVVAGVAGTMILAGACRRPLPP